MEDIERDGGQGEVEVCVCGKRERETVCVWRESV